MKTKIIYVYYCKHCKLQRQSVKKEFAEKKVCFKCQKLVDAEVNQQKLNL